MKFLLGDDACFMVENIVMGKPLEELKENYPKSIWLGFDDFYDEDLYQTLERNYPIISNNNQDNKEIQQSKKPTYEDYLKYKEISKLHNVLILKVFNASSNIRNYIIFKAVPGKHQVFGFGRTPDNEVNVNLSDISRKHLR